MISQDLIVAPTQSRPPALIEGSGRKARDRIEHFLRAAIDNDNTRVMVFTFARTSAACGMNVGDIFYQQRRFWVRLHEKGGKFHEMPCHHTLEGYLTEYIERARLAEAGRGATVSSHQGSPLRSWGGDPQR